MVVSAAQGNAVGLRFSVGHCRRICPLSGQSDDQPLNSSTTMADGSVDAGIEGQIASSEHYWRNDRPFGSETILRRGNQSHAIQMLQSKLCLARLHSATAPGSKGKFDQVPRRLWH